MEWYLHFLFLFRFPYFTGPGLVCFLFGFLVRSLANCFSVPYICSFFLVAGSFVCWLFSRSANPEHARFVPLPVHPFFVCVFMLFVFHVLFVVFCVSVSCAVLMLGRSHSLFRLSLFPKPVFIVSFDGCVLSFFPVLPFVALTWVGSGCVLFTLFFKI